MRINSAEICLEILMKPKETLPNEGCMAPSGRPANLARSGKPFAHKRNFGYGNRCTAEKELVLNGPTGQRFLGTLAMIGKCLTLPSAFVKRKSKCQVAPIQRSMQRFTLRRYFGGRQTDVNRSHLRRWDIH